MASIDDQPRPKGLKRLSLTPGARAPLSALASPVTPQSASLIDDSAPASPSPLNRALSNGHGRRYGPRRTSSISYYNSSSLSPSPTSATSDSFARTSIPPTIHEVPASPALRSAHGHRRALSASRKALRRLSVEKAIVLPVDKPAPAQSPVPAPPQTLVEKHADLLSFIAKKESKCMELRDQLAQHESELATLKRKWERIMSRAANPASNGATATTGSSPESSPVPGAKPLPLGQGDSVDVVGAIRDGVQGLGRMLVMGGLGSTGQPSQSRATSAATGSSPPMFADAPSPSSANTGTSSRNSSISSMAAASPPGSSAGRTSLSSVTSMASDEDQGSVDSSFLTSKDTLVRDGGHTPTPDSVTTWFDDIAIPVSNPAATIKRDTPKTQVTAPKPSSGYSSPRGSLNLADRLPEKKTPARLTSPISPSSSSSSWVPSSLNKRLEGLQKSETLSKTSKRASLLFSDVTSASSSLLGSLAGALATPSPTQSPSISISTAANQQARYFQMQAVESPKRETSPSFASLLDEDDEDQLASSASPIPAQKLSASLAPPMKPTSSNHTIKKVSSFDNDEWNW